MIEEPPKLTVHCNRRRPSEAQIAAFRGATTGNVCDAMHGRGVMSSAICPLFPGQAQVAGPALTADQGPADILATLSALAYIQPGDVLVAATGGHQGCAAAGDRVAGMARNGGAVALVTDGPVRDLDGLEAVGLPVWSTGLNPGSPFTKGPGSVGGPLHCGGQRVETGDIVVADRDGVVVVPFDRIDETIAALAHVRALETALDAEVAEGLSCPPAIHELIDSEETRFVE